jgi:SAM-dependent methyltransferase
MSNESYHCYPKYGKVEADTYEALRIDEQLWHLENAPVEQYFSTRAFRNILDIPVGTGRFLQYFPKDADVLGIDISEHMLAKARHKRDTLGMKRVRLQKGDIFELKVDDRSFDAIICFRLLHLLPRDHLVAALKELRRVLNGTLITQAYVHGTPLRRFASRAARFAGRMTGLSRPQHPLRSSQHLAVWIHSRAQFDSAFVEAGLRIQSDTLVGHYYGHQVRIFLLEPDV